MTRKQDDRPRNVLRYFMGLVLAVVIAVAVVPLKGSENVRVQYVYHIINARGLLRYLTMFTAMGVILCAAGARRFSDRRRQLANRLLILSAIPLLSGILNFGLGLRSVAAHTAVLHSEGASPVLIKEIKALGCRISFDTIILALVFGTPAVGMAVNLRRKAERGGQNGTDHLDRRLQRWRCNA